MTAQPGLLKRPLPATVCYNQWPDVPLTGGSAFEPMHPVSVIVPSYQAPAALALTLAGLERQDWPRELMEVVVVDDGSNPPIEPPPSTRIKVRVVRQVRRGFGLARARNTGVRAAAHDILVFLDGDVIPEEGLIRAHAHWHHAVSDALTLGFCAYVSVDGLSADAVRNRRGSLEALFGSRPFDRPWLERHMARTADFTSRRCDLFRAVTGHNFGISRGLFEEAGAFDASFNRYGGEDTEFAYRVQVHGGLLVPVRPAFGWHQGRWSEGREGKERDMDRQADKLAGLIAEPGFRQKAPSHPYAVPRHVVTLDAGEERLWRVAEAARTLCSDPAGDLGVCIEAPAGQNRLLIELKQRLKEFASVRVVGAAATRGRAALDAFPASPIHIRAPIPVVLAWGDVEAPQRVALLGSALGEAVHATAEFEDRMKVSVFRAWALHRARRAGGKPGDYGETRTLSARWMSRKSQSAAVRSGRGRPLPTRRGFHAVAARIRAEIDHVRGPRTAWRFVRWFAAAALWRLREGKAWLPTPAPGPSSIAPGIALADAPLGVRLGALGRRSRVVFSASSRVALAVADQPFDVALADTVAAGAGVRAPVADLEGAPALAVSAFDPAVDNPVGWVRDVEPKVLSLGPRSRLPAGVKVHREVALDNRRALRHCHHVEDVAAFHADAIERAGALAQLAARGVPVHLADRDPSLSFFLGSELHDLMTVDIRNAGAAEREAHSVAQRRAALRTHSLRARARQVCEAAGVKPPPFPRVSVLLATHRPALLAHAVANVARQRYPQLELVLALHGPGFDSNAVESALVGCAHAVKILRADAKWPLGVVLDTASAAATGSLLAKMDDDDVYGPEHLWDLVLAHEYSGAVLVGKFLPPCISRRKTAPCVAALYRGRPGHAPLPAARC